MDAPRPLPSTLLPDARPPRVISWTDKEFEAPRPRVVSLSIRSKSLRTWSCRFVDDPQAAEADEPAMAAAAPTTGSTPPERGAFGTRIRPPTDVIRLKDRLFYLLQPPLESWTSSQQLEFPFPPFPYQWEGVAFLYPRHSALLADEMGLGKTMQTITTIRLLMRAGEVRQALLICPKPLVTNWQREFSRWAPEIPLITIEGDAPRRAWQWRLPDPAVKIANYELVVRDREQLAACGGDPLWTKRRRAPGESAQNCEAEDRSHVYDLVILDEAQRIKNRGGTTAEVVRSIPRRRSWALTGTPVENSPEDLIGIFEFMAPGHLSPDLKPRRMGKLAADYVLRRTKDRVLKDLPPKMFRDAELELSPAQRDAYRRAEDDGVLQLSQMGQLATIHHVFELILRLKQICNFDPATGESAKFERLAADLEEVAASGRKALVFSQWVETLDQLAERLQSFGPLCYHGRIPSSKRDGIIERFRSDANSHVLLMSYGAGGVGLNLQFAGYVFLFDRWWNPAVEDQAINRAHRIGAAGPVTVTRFQSLGTIEQRIDQILQEKRELFDTVFSDAAEPKNLGLTHNEIFGLFQLRSPQGPIRLAG